MERGHEVKEMQQVIERLIDHDEEGVKIANFEALKNGCYGWSVDRDTAIDMANDAARCYRQRHRVYWSPAARAWMVRRARSRPTWLPAAP